MKCNSPHSSIFMRSLFFYCLLGAGHEEHWLFWKPGWTVACLWWCQMTHLYLYVEVQHNCTPTLPHFTFLRGSLLSLWNPSFMSIPAGFYSLFDCILALENLRSAGMCRISLRCSVFLFYFLEWIKEKFGLLVWELECSSPSKQKLRVYQAAGWPWWVSLTPKRPAVSLSSNTSASHAGLLLQLAVQTNWTIEDHLEGRVTVEKLVSIVGV